MLIGASSANAQRADLFQDPAVMELVEEALIADLMARSCERVRGSEDGVAAMTERADNLARAAGYEPDEAYAFFSTPENLPRVEAGATSRLARMGARPDDLTSLCRLAQSVAGRGGVLGALLLPRF